MKEKEKKKVSSLQDLADLAGVSRSTASRALNDSSLISKKTRQKLHRLAREHNYSINKQARDFRLSRTGVISVVFMLDVESEQHMSEPFFLEMLGSIADSLASHEYDLLLAHAPVVDVLGLRDNRVIRNADGVIFVGQAEQHEALNELADNGTPMVVWGGRAHNKRYVLVGSDNNGGGYSATHHLLELGRRKIGFIGNTQNPEISARYAGYATALTEFGLQTDGKFKCDVPFELANAKVALRKAVDKGPSFDALFCATDFAALAAIATLTDLGFRIPDDIAIVGFDDLSLAAYSTPALTTVRQNIRWAGHVLVESVLGMIKDEAVTDTMLSCDLVIRQSCGAEHRVGH